MKKLPKQFAVGWIVAGMSLAGMAGCAHSQAKPEEQPSASSQDQGIQSQNLPNEQEPGSAYQEEQPGSTFNEQQPLQQQPQQQPGCVAPSGQQPGVAGTDQGQADGCACSCHVQHPTGQAANTATAPGTMTPGT